MSFLSRVRPLCNARAAMVLTLPLLLDWTAWPLALTLLHVPVLTVCAMPVAVAVYLIQAIIAALDFLRPDLPWFRVAVGAVLTIVVLARLSGRLTGMDAETLRRDGPQVRRVLLGVAAALAGAGFLRAFPLEMTWCWAAILAIVALALPRAQSRPSTRERAGTLALFAAACIVALSLGEVGARIYFGPPHFDATMAHRERLRAPRPGGQGVYHLRMGKSGLYHMPFTFSGDGLRNPPITPKEPGITRILALGDSFTFGSGVLDDEAYPRALERLLNARAGERRFEVINAGVGGTGPYQQLKLFLELAPWVEPDLVVHQLLLANDLLNDLVFTDLLPESYNHLQVCHAYFHRKGPFWLIRLTEELRGRSALFLALWQATGATWESLDLGRHVRGFTPIDYPQPGEGAMRPALLETLRRQWCPALKEGWKLNRKHVRLVRDYCAGSGIDYFAFAAPIVEEVSTGVWNHLPTYVHALEGNMHRYDQEKNARITREFFRAQGIPHTDMRRAFREHDHPERLYYLTDSHWNLHGCRYAAEVVANALAAWWPGQFPPKSARADSAHAEVTPPDGTTAFDDETAPEQGAALEHKLP